MPISKNRRKHKHHQYHPKAQPKGGQTAHAAAKPTARRSAVTIMVVLLAIFGAGIAFLSAGANATWIAGGALLGAITGFFTGQGMDKMAAKSK
ncbi:hypothetical protein [Pseudoflavitalea rhizosphaerae]|uniref:hypothetical protein n=1 Tax=Pseudoflavitalea rhizosphaerae TaxID=1884793 RepID=UPI000F8F3E8C|nr:hypothetical protein [Pseudoflavitalea rhizosphaerae]